MLNQGRIIALTVGGVGVFLCLGLFAATSFTKQEKRTVKVTYYDTNRMPDGTYRHRGTRIRYKDVIAGEFKEIIYDPEHKETSYTLYCKQGMFVAKNNGSGLIEPLDDFVPAKPAERIEETHSKYAIGRASILGYNAYVRKTSDGLTEIWSVPELGSTLPLKMVLYSKGSDAYTVSEAVAVEWVTLPSDFFQVPSNLKIDLSGLERRIQIAEENNYGVLVEKHRKQLARWKALQTEK